MNDPGPAERTLGSAGALATLAALCWLVGACGLSSPSREAQEAGSLSPLPSFDNIIVIMIDTLRSDHLQAYGYSRPTAPFLDRLAEEGIRLQGYSATAWTRPSIATLFTGLHPQRHRTNTRADALPEEVTYIPELLQRNGFSTYAVISNLNVGHDVGFARGYDEFHEQIGPKPRARTVTDRILEEVKRVDPRRRFFLNIHYIDPHDPYKPERLWGQDSGEAAELIQPIDVLQGKVELDSRTRRQLIDQYDGEIRSMDRQIARLLEDLGRQGLLDGTLVVVTSDHGEEFGDHGSVGHGSTLYREMLEVPFILWSAAGLANYSSPEFFHQVDFLPTILDSLAVEIPGGLDGKTRFTEIFRGSYQTPPELLFHNDLDGRSALALIEPPFKIIHQKWSPTNALYQMEVDRDEQRPSRNKPSVREELLEKLLRRHNDLSHRAADRSHAVVKDAARRQLLALGYIESESEEMTDDEKPPIGALSFFDAREHGLFGDESPESFASQLHLGGGGGEEQLLSGWIQSDGKGRYSRPKASFVLPRRQGATELTMKGHAHRTKVRCCVTINRGTRDCFRLSRGEFEIAMPLPKDERPWIYVDLEVSPALRLDATGHPVALHWQVLGVQ